MYKVQGTRVVAVCEGYNNKTILFEVYFEDLEKAKQYCLEEYKSVAGEEAEIPWYQLNNIWYSPDLLRRTYTITLIRTLD